VGSHPCPSAMAARPLVPFAPEYSSPSREQLPCGVAKRAELSRRGGQAFVCSRGNNEPKWSQLSARGKANVRTEFLSPSSECAWFRIKPLVLSPPQDISCPGEHIGTAARHSCGDVRTIWGAAALPKRGARGTDGRARFQANENFYGGS
jgi:hypothetical protein